MEEEQNPWTVKSTAVRYDNPWIRVIHQEVLNPAGGEGIYGTVHFKNLAIGIIPLDEDGNTWIVGQYRFPLNVYTWEIPEGGGPRNTSPLESAKRELLEECGIVAKSWSLIQEMQLSNSASDEVAYIYLARDLQFQDAQPEETEQLQVHKIPFEELYQMVANGQCQDSLTVAGVYRLRLMMMEGKLV